MDRQNEKRPIEGDFATAQIPGYRPRPDRKTFTPTELYWQQDSANKLKDLLLGLDLMGVITDPSGNKVPFSKVVTEFFRFFHLQLGDARDVKSQIKNRSYKVADFTNEIKVNILAWHKDVNSK